MGPYKPDWMERPSGEVLWAYYPDHAQRIGIPGKATINCAVMADGHLGGCVVIEESPKGEHFGDAALRVSEKFRMIPPDDSKASPETVTIPLVFALPTPTNSVGVAAEEAHIFMSVGLGVAAVSMVLLVLVTMVLGRYHLTMSGRSAGKP